MPIATIPFSIVFLLQAAKSCLFCFLGPKNGRLSYEKSMSSKLMNTYGARSLTLVKGEGATLWDDQGNQYLDALAGIAVCGLGHAHPAVTKAISEQAGQLLHVSNLYNLPPQQKLADQLTALTGMDQVFFSNSGAEANEAAIKIARKYGNDNGVANGQIIVAQGSFHGRTLATLSATGNPKVHAGFEPLVASFIRVPYDNIEAMQKAISENSNVVAVFVEPVQGEGGVHVPADDYLSRIRQLCTDNGLLMMLDEIQTGNGRTGKPFACQHSGVLPDVLTTAKGLGNGAPIGACLTSGLGNGVLVPGNHGSTFGGNPLSCSAASAVLTTLIEENLCERVTELGDYFLKAFADSLSDCVIVKDIRGQGLMIGIELDRPCTELVAQAQAKGLLINVTVGNTIRLLPPFIISDAEAQQIVQTVSDIIKAFA